MKPTLDELEALVRSKICAVCTDLTVDGACGLEGDAGCRLFDLFPLVVQAIVATESAGIEAYRQAIRENVCSVCMDSALDGSCPRRGNACSLDAYLGQIVEIVEEATGRSVKRGTTPMAGGS